jgi:hypothetical protein
MPHILHRRRASSRTYPVAGGHHRMRRCVAARNDNNRTAEKTMTAYLISLALAGLMAIIIWEGMS